jgi:hypothetical protein
LPEPYFDGKIRNPYLVFGETVNADNSDKYLASDDRRLAALGTFERWSNYLLVTTVAAAGWVATSAAGFHSSVMRSLAIWSFGTAIVFGIFTLALLPPLTEQITQRDKSIFRVQVDYPLFTLPRRTYLTQVYQPQHIAFIAGTIFYCIGTSYLWAALVALGVRALLFACSKPRGPFWVGRRVPDPIE